MLAAGLALITTGESMAPATPAIEDAEGTPMIYDAVETAPGRRYLWLRP